MSGWSHDEEDGFPYEDYFDPNIEYVDDELDFDLFCEYYPTSGHFKVDKHYKDMVLVDIEEGSDIMGGLIYDYCYEGVSKKIRSMLQTCGRALFI